MTETSSWKLIFKGIVQGVGFRPTVYRIAHQLHSHGYVLNKGSVVEVVIDTDPDEFIAALTSSLPTLAHISSVEKHRISQHYDSFQIKQSSDGKRQSLIPVDTAICKDCLQELFDRDNRRYQFPFTNCTICGARYSAITAVPYDREKTSMEPFPLCTQCNNEYSNPLDRRYHAQTISCPTCGPTYNLYDTNGKKTCTQTKAIKQFAEQLDQGRIGVVKSWGGMHLCCTLEETNRFREWYHRPQKPFALMVDSIKTAETYAKITTEEKNLLLSSQRPIVLVKKKKAKTISPGLDDIGLFLPYTGLHHLLFSHLENNALIMTSANTPGEPMITENKDAFSLHADWYLLHNRNIPNRVDDSLIKCWNTQQFFIRKARGYVPDPITVDYSTHILSVGAGENVYGALSSDKQLLLTPYIGNTSSYQALSDLKHSLTHLMRLTMKKPYLDAVAMDAHPGYESRQIAHAFSERFDTPLFEVQHHWAHAVSLLADNKVDQGIVLSLDGLGYGSDDTFWGGEILLCDAKSFQRIGHLEPIPLIGGDQAAIDPRRVLFAIFDRFGKERFFTGSEADLFRKLILNSPKSSSLGRILDALSCYLGICCRRTYDGEPAMKLEPYLSRGKAVHEFDLSIQQNILLTSSLFNQLDEMNTSNLSEQQRADIVYSFVDQIMNALTDIVLKQAANKHLDHIGITGGISYNIPIIEMVQQKIKKQGYELLVHKRVPNGDGGIAIGQNIIAAKKL